jgi:hypothetical protein
MSGLPTSMWVAAQNHSTNDANQRLFYSSLRPCSAATLFCFSLCLCNRCFSRCWCCNFSARSLFAFRSINLLCLALFFVFLAFPCLGMVGKLDENF